MDKVQNKPNSSVQHTPSPESFQVNNYIVKGNLGTRIRMHKNCIVITALVSTDIAYTGKSTEQISIRIFMEFAIRSVVGKENKEENFM
jgi:hypothetical protein